MSKHKVIKAQAATRSLVNTDDPKTFNEIHEEHYSIIDSWFSNGFNGRLAIQQARPELNERSAQVTFATLIKSDHVKAYIQQKKQAARASIATEPEMILRTLQTWLQADATQLIGLSVDDLKSLPGDIKQCIQSIKHRVKEYQDRNGNNVREESIEVRIVDKIKALEMINKHIGFYSEDNKQRAVKIDIKKVDINLLNQLLQAEIKE